MVQIAGWVHKKRTTNSEINWEIEKSVIIIFDVKPEIGKEQNETI